MNINLLILTSLDKDDQLGYFCEKKIDILHKK